MCAPLLLAAPAFMTSLAVSAATGLVTYMGQKQAADAQYETAVANNEALRNAAISDMVQKGNDLNARQQQETASTALNVQNQRMASDRAAATARANSESAGLSVDQLFADYDRQYLSYADSQMQQLGFNTEQINRSREQITAQTQNRINTGWDNKPIQGPSLGGTLLGIAGDGLNAYSKFSVRDPMTGKRTLT